MPWLLLVMRMRRRGGVLELVLELAGGGDVSGRGGRVGHDAMSSRPGAERPL